MDPCDTGGLVATPHTFFGTRSAPCKTVVPSNLTQIQFSRPNAGDSATHQWNISPHCLCQNPLRRTGAESFGFGVAGCENVGIMVKIWQP